MTILVNEHRFLGRMLDFAQDLATQMRRHEDVQPQTLGRSVEFFRVCMEDCLLAKEEDLLFPRLETKGLFRRGGVIASMLIDHERGRRPPAPRDQVVDNTQAECISATWGYADAMTIW